MSAGQCLPIKSVVPQQFYSGTVLCFMMLLFFNGVKCSRGPRLTHMSAPLVADFRDQMELECDFDLAGEELYAVKWYKDDQEFFRFTPPHTMVFPVSGVHLVHNAINCSLGHCKVQLKDLTRGHSGGFYRCEVSTEAPTFRLIAETRRVTVAALPRENPRIEGLASSYAEGDPVDAKCVSDPADPAPILSWYVNGLEAPSQLVGDMTSSDPDSSGLSSRSLSIHFLADRKYSLGDNIELQCTSSLPGIPLLPQETAVKIPIRSADPQVVNNQKLHWSSSAGTKLEGAWGVLIVSAVRWMMGGGM